MLATLTALATKQVAVYAGMGVAGVVTAFVLKKIPNATIKAKFGSWMYNLGVLCTLGMGKWKWTKKVWNKTIEPYFVDAIDNILVTGIAKFVDGLRSDNA
tara:strand:- start:3755 stop:4054 length:300 start_codon:yes stop_codon:yes gene_type:complete